MIFSMAIDPMRRDFGQEVRDVFYDEHLKENAVAKALRLHPSHLSRALNGEQGYAVDLLRLGQLALEFGEQGERTVDRIFARVSILMRRKRMARADLRSTSDKQGVA